ncbi:hypothetical protein EVAR_80678_1 [Eumeta japonica]|uniref:Uncharacterized protein n=1 Tax=Eumeta variegata TaxID=151549 RepID=A0A4C1U3Q5_EUMVA|nr:hypothetical protein EVAR_80678_1 [Eumeta japonica]
MFLGLVVRPCHFERHTLNLGSDIKVLNISCLSLLESGGSGVVKTAAFEQEDVIRGVNVEVAYAIARLFYDRAIETNGNEPSVISEVSVLIRIACAILRRVLSFACPASDASGGR